MYRDISLPGETRPSILRRVGHYAAAVALSAAAYAAIWALRPVLPSGHFSLFMIAVLVMANMGGAGPALVTMALGGIVIPFAFVPPYYTLHFTQPVVVRLCLYTLTCLVGIQLSVRKREALRWLREVLATRDMIARATNDAVWEWDLRNDTIRWNEAAEEVFGINRHTSGNDVRSWTDGIHPADTERVMKSIDKALESRAGVWSDHYRYRKKDGSYALVFDRGYVIRDGSGQAVQMIGSMLDLSERVAAQQKRMEHESRLRRQAQLLDLAHDAIIVRTLPGNIVFWNKGAEEMYGWTADEVIGRMTRDVFGTQTGSVQEEADHRLRISGRWDGELVHRRRSGEDIAISARWLLSKDGDDMVVLEINHDVTERRRYEQHLLQQAEELSRSNQELEQFAYVASHDLQEPLRKISNYSELLAKKTGDKLEGTGSHYLSAIVSSAGRMQELIHDLLAYSRVTRSETGRSSVDVRQVLDLVLTDLDSRLSECHGRVVAEGPLPVVEASPTELRQVLQNLIGNAIKFNRSPEPEVRISAVSSQGYCVISVADNGIGIEKDYHEKIFKVFHRLHTRDKFPGTGIGLAICKKIIERHGGKIWIDSEAGRGSTFLFTLPVATPSPTLQAGATLTTAS